MRETILTSSVLILILIVLRYSLRRRISLRLQYGLWGFAALRLIMPFSLFSSPLSIMNIVADNSIINETSNFFPDGLHNLQVTPEPSLDGLTNAVTPAIQPGDQNIAALTSMPHTMSLQETLMIIWLVGAIVVAAWLIITNLQLKQRLRTAELCREINCVLPVYRANWLPSSCLFGLLHPAIYLNASAYKNKYTLHHVLTHELCHHVHRDQLWSLVRGLCLVLHWYNPLVWVAAALSKRDCELACDEASIAQLGEAERVPYGMTILTLVQQSTVYSPLASIATTMANGKRSLKERVTLISKKPKLMMIVTIGLVLVMAITVGCTFTGAKVEENVAEIGDVKEAFLTVYGTYNYENRYDIWLNNIDDVGGDITVEKQRVMQEEYYACIRDYVNEEFYLRMVANREIIKHEKYACENGISYRTDGFKFEEYSKNTDSTTYSFVANVILTGADGTEKKGTVNGQISVSDKDGLISDFYLSPTGFQSETNTTPPTGT